MERANGKESRAALGIRAVLDQQTARKSEL